MPFVACDDVGFDSFPGVDDLNTLEGDGVACDGVEVRLGRNYFDFR
jgi:hypothetical protein